ncbi:hypothetical protein OJF2_23850 [Aquisphaera giovannonii]|uniref:YdbS-like PH domain-containing protein n=1 Tax=Aquisphaera giovannonii TaxID=406548 RepID=A0A5B9W0W0_9BACT|nr:PH domain-containing protein [Aquisphaera giovannonii]QEH33854.1 hypothetical protein OJF2_23850 [Aquisphaera giovannonii]
MDESAEEKIRPELTRSEKLVWCGQPPQGFMLRAADALLIPFSILWGGFAVFWEVTAIAMGAPVFFVLWGIPFVLMGLYITVGRFWADARRRASTVYAVTSERVLIVSGVWTRSVKSLDIASLTDMALTERRDGAGTITFGSVPYFYGWYAASGWPGLAAQQVPSFDLADGARQVYEQIRAVQKASRQHA